MNKIIFLTGYYGSGKSEVAINLSIHKNVDYLIDLDIINPYFRTRELNSVCDENKINLISSSLENSLGSDLPYISHKVFRPFYENKKAIYDLGGDILGAKLINQFKDFNLKDVELLLVINVFREETCDENKILNLIDKMNASSNLKITGLINNTNLLKETTYEDILYGQSIINKVSELTNLNIMYTCVLRNLLTPEMNLKGEIIPIDLFLRKEWM